MILAYVRINRFLKYSVTVELGEVEFDCEFPDGELNSGSSTSSADGLLGVVEVVVIEDLSTSGTFEFIICPD